MALAWKKYRFRFSWFRGRAVGREREIKQGEGIFAMVSRGGDKGVEYRCFGSGCCLLILRVGDVRQFSACFQTHGMPHSFSRFQVGNRVGFLDEATILPKLDF